MSESFDKKKTVVAITGLVVLFWAGIMSAILLQLVPVNPITMKVQKPILAQMILPQGWSFFTRNPREARLHVYLYDDGKWVNGSLGANAEPRNGMGASRIARSQGVELGLLMSLTDISDWEDCDLDIQSCLNKISIADTVVSADPHPTLCNQVAMFKQELVPWSWRESKERISMPINAVKLFVSCENDG